MMAKCVERTKRVMVNDFKCEKGCIDEVIWADDNPIDFALFQDISFLQNCNCVSPIQPVAMIDWSSQDFYSVTLQEWLDIAT